MGQRLRMREVAVQVRNWESSEVAEYIEDALKRHAWVGQDNAFEKVGVVA